MLRKLTPYKIRLSFKLLKRSLKDYKNGINRNLAKNKIQNHTFKYQIKLSQPIRNSYLSNNKIKNLNVASKKISAIYIKPQEIFSFWNLVGKPTIKKGYYKGRNIVNGKLNEDIGGGLCQLSGIIYHISLLANLKIIERFNHTIDIYTDKTRFTPLGSDATVVFGFKDLRIVNNFDFDIRFNFEILDDKITVLLESEKQIKMQKIFFKKIKMINQIFVETKGEQNKIIAKSLYLVTNH